LETTQSPDLHDSIVLAVNTAARLGELNGITRAAINLERNYVTVVNGKIGGTRDIPLNEVARKVLRERKENARQERIFTTLSTSLSTMFGRTVKQLGIHDLHFHDFRHTAITRMVNAGTNLFVLQRITGHSRLETLQGYYSMIDTDLHRAVSSLEDLNGLP
jgi:integrase